MKTIKQAEQNKGTEKIHCPQVVKAVSELDEYNPWIINHAQQHHTQIIYLECAPVSGWYCVTPLRK